MADTPVILPDYLLLRQTTTATPCSVCQHQRWKTIWKRFLHASSFWNAELTVMQNPPAETSLGDTRPPTVAISFANDEDLTRPVSEIVDAIIHPKSFGVSSVVMSRNDVNSVVQALRAFLQQRPEVTRIPSKAANQHRLLSTTQPTLARRRSLP
ncbi:hypothetical protein BD410DRAFT_5470 [Rickenella mellea]|uniref:Uncharacterized protein n=1 Tax=Rickenella mellea TaxID=50990 RepID=A0A4R5XG51_9AGAM|nr:hypothetical protein BD410DRAFT_5470 [Rickenella mellea]